VQNVRNFLKPLIIILLGISGSLGNLKAQGSFNTLKQFTQIENFYTKYAQVLLSDKIDLDLVANTIFSQMDITTFQLL